MKYSIPSFDLCNTESCLTSLHICTIFKNKSPIIRTTNEPIAFKLPNGDYSLTTHAEMNAIHKLKNRLNKNRINKTTRSTNNRTISRYTMIIVRYGRNGQLLNSYPCNLCIEIIKSIGINIEKIIYSSENGEIISCSINDLEYNDRQCRLL